MSGPASASTAEVREAVYEFQRYLSDEIAPMMALDSVELLLRCPPDLVAQQIQGWIGAQSLGAGKFTVSDYIFHAVKKLHLMSEFDLIPREALDRYLSLLTRELLPLCPESEREVLADNLGRLGESEGSLASQVDVIHSQTRRGGLPGGEPAATAATAATTAVSEDVARSLKRFSMLVGRLQSTATSDAPAEATISQAVASAAIGSRDGDELERHLAELARAGYDASPGQIFRSLGHSLPGWTLPNAEAGGAAPPAAHQLEAMRKIIAMAPDAQTGAQRFVEMVDAAIEQFNEGRLVQATRMFELAERIISEKQLGEELARSTRSRSHEKLAAERLREYANDAKRHPHLKCVLDFFEALGPAKMLDDLNGELRRDRRRLLLALLEVHGEALRGPLMTYLEAKVAAPESDPHGWFRRNLVFLLKRLPQSASDTPRDHERNLLIRCLDWGTPLMLIKEAIGAVGQIPGDASVQALITLLQGYEGLLSADEVDPYGAEEVRGLVDRAVAALVRLGTPVALQIIVEHGLNKPGALGNPAARLEELSSHDLGKVPHACETLVAVLRAELPMKVLGFLTNRSDGRVVHLVRALSGTPTPDVRLLLEEIVERFPDRDFGQTAQRTLEGFGAAARPTENRSESLTGDIELFGLPNLLQTLSESRVTGLLSLTDREGAEVGSIQLAEGRVADCRAGMLRAQTAFYQLFERPVPGSFHFKNRGGIPEEDRGHEPFEVLPETLEALRRHDEFQQARALIPDDASFLAGDAKPTRPADEEHDPVVRGVWKLASTQANPEKCERVLPADAYRIRRLYAHWLEEGALKPSA